MFGDGRDQMLIYMILRIIKKRGHLIKRTWKIMWWAKIFNKFADGQISFDQCLKEIEEYYNNVILQKIKKIDKREEEVNWSLLLNKKKD